MKRTYILLSPEPGMKGRTIGRYSSENGEHVIAVLHLPDGTPSETMGEVLDALRRAREEGREERSAELIPLGQPADYLRSIVRDEAIGAISEWGTGWTSPIDDQEPRQHYITLEDTDDANHALVLAIGAERYNMTRRFRVSVLVEEIEPR